MLEAQGANNVTDEKTEAPIGIIAEKEDKTGLAAGQLPFVWKSPSKWKINVMELSRELRSTLMFL